MTTAPATARETAAKPTAFLIADARKAAETKDSRLRHAAKSLVAQTFYGQMLKQMRESPFKSELFEGGRGGQAFNSMLDGMLAARMTRGAGGKLVDAIVRSVDGPGTPRLPPSNVTMPDPVAVDL